MEGDYIDVALFSSGTYKIKMMVETEATSLFPIVSVIDTGALQA